jgi:hypothetical protein
MFSPQIPPLNSFGGQFPVLPICGYLETKIASRFGNAVALVQNSDKKKSAALRGHMSDSQNHDPILSRIERLEKENRAWKSAVVLCLIAFASIGLMGQTTTTQHKKTPAAPKPAPAPAAPVLPKNIEAESFTLKDASGKSRAELSMSGTGPAFKLLDQNGSALVTLSLNDSAPGGPFVLLSDPQHHSGLTMSVLENAGSQLLLTGDRPDIMAHIGVAPDGTTLEISDRDGFSTSMGDGMQTAKNGQLKKTTAASITLYNKDRKVLWSTP